MLKLIPPLLSSRVARLLALATVATGSSWAAATVGTFTGGDPDEGLDLQGNFTYAINVGPNGAVGKVGDATFTADNTPGVTVEAANNINVGGWLESSYGDTTNDNNLELVLNSIRWAAAPAVVTVRLRVETGIEYKLQILEGEDCCLGRGFNIEINGVTEVANFMPGMVQSPGGDFFTEKEITGAVITHQFIAPTNEVVIVLSGPAADSEEITDRNAILNGFTLERLSAFTDVDSDGLRDDWEIQFFGDTGTGPGDDTDSDGLTNLEEFNAQIDPSKADTDGDGLDDGIEVKTALTDPLKVDTDSDGLFDGVEVNVYQTDPKNKDTDSDTLSDFTELSFFTDPKSASNGPVVTTVGLFTGGDTDEGLDLQGTFPYALDHAAEGVAGGQAGDALFTEEITDGAIVTTGQKTGVWNTDIVYGESPADLVLADVMSSISWSAADQAISDVTVEMGNLTVGSSYKLQLLFAEQAWPRGFDVYVDGLLVANDFSPAYYQGGGFPITYPDDRGVVLTHSFVARTNSISFVLDGRGTTTPAFTDHNAIINGSTLELLAPLADTDSDTLPDPWEIAYWGNLEQTAAGDPDADVLSNADEFAYGSDPTKADRDNDGLNDSQEKSAGTLPGFADTDRDGLSDSDEVNTYHTNPLLADSDGDLVSDMQELIMGSDPNVVFETVTEGVTIGAITGGDEGEGLDLDGTFTYAFSILTNTAATGQVRNVTFTSENVPGVTVLYATSMAANWYVPDFGETANDDALERIIGNIRHGGGGANITLSNLVTGRKYKLQLMFGEQCCFRGMDVYVDGKLVADEFAPYVIMEGINNTLQAAVVSYELTAKTNKIIIQTLGSTVTTEEYVDRNPIINAVTLEDLGGGVVVPVAPVIRSITKGAGMVITFDSTAGGSYTLQYKATLTDATWTDVVTDTATGASTSLTDNDATRLDRPFGFLRIKTQ